MTNAFRAAQKFDTRMRALDRAAAVRASSREMRTLIASARRCAELEARVAAWEPIVRAAIDARATDEAYREGVCSSWRVVLYDARYKAASRLVWALNALPAEHRPEPPKESDDG